MDAAQDWQTLWITAGCTAPHKLNRMRWSTKALLPRSENFIAPNRDFKKSWGEAPVISCSRHNFFWVHFRFGVFRHYRRRQKEQVKKLGTLDKGHMKLDMSLWLLELQLFHLPNRYYQDHSSPYLQELSMLSLVYERLSPFTP